MLRMLAQQNTGIETDHISTLSFPICYRRKTFNNSARIDVDVVVIKFSNCITLSIFKIFGSNFVFFLLMDTHFYINLFNTIITFKDVFFLHCVPFF